jgi:hypothetical protein
MRYLAGFVAAGAVSLSSATLPAAAQTAPAAAAQPQAVVGRTVLSTSQTQISGRVITPGGAPVSNVTVRARNMLSGQVGGSTSTTAAGQFSINIESGSYLLEVVDGGGQIIGTSAFMSATAGTTITSVVVTVSSGALSAVTTTGGLVSTLGATAARSVAYAAAAAGVAGVVSAPDVVTASPSR